MTSDCPTECRDSETNPKCRRGEGAPPRWRTACWGTRSAGSARRQCRQARRQSGEHRPLFARPKYRGFEPPFVEKIVHGSVHWGPASRLCWCTLGAVSLWPRLSKAWSGSTTVECRSAFRAEDCRWWPQRSPAMAEKSRRLYRRRKSESGSDLNSGKGDQKKSSVRSSSPAIQSSDFRLRESY